VSTVPTDPVQPGASLVRATSPQGGAASSGETSPFEVLLGTGHTPPSPASSKQAPSRAAAAAATGQSTMPAPAASQRRAPLAAPGPQSAAAPTHGSNDDSSERAGLVDDFNQQDRVAADAPGMTATRPTPTLTDPAGANPTGEPMAAGHGSALPDDPRPATVARKSDKAAVKSGDAGTATLPAPALVGAATPQVADPTIPTPAATAVAPAPAAAPTAPVPAAPQPAAVAAATAAAPAAPTTVPSSGGALGSPPTAATPPAGDSTSLLLNPTAPGPQAAALPSAAVEPTSAESGEKPANSAVASDDGASAKPMVAGGKPTQALAGAPRPTAGSGTGEPVQGANASATASAANGAKDADLTLGGGAHVAPPGAAPANPDAAAGPSGAAVTQSAAPPASANSLIPSTAAPLAAAPTTSSPSSPAGVPISGLAVEIAARVTRDEKSFQIRLDPPELGRIDVQLSVDASGHVTTHLTADRPETLNLLRQDASSLQRALESTGLKTGSGGLEFSLRHQSSGGEGGGQRGGQSNGTASPVARIIVSDEDMPAGQTAPRGYARLLGVGSGVDIRV
jgi:flagellar hook-length control protein FliK